MHPRCVKFFVPCNFKTLFFFNTMDEFLETTLKDWSKIFTVTRYFWDSYVFRGQLNSSWLLETSIERAMRNFSSKFHDKGYSYEEQGMLNEFKRKYHLFSSQIPKQNDNVEWLAIMQHHGAPTRLLDFTKSLMIASYFGVSDALDECSIWAIHVHKITNILANTNKADYVLNQNQKEDTKEVLIEYANKYIGTKTGIYGDKIPNLVIPLEPKICTERLSRQQGLFLMPVNCNKTFLENFISIYSKKAFNLKAIDFSEFVRIANRDPWSSDNSKVIKINIPKSLHKEILHSLTKMNITAETLFPGLDGLVKSLQQSHISL
jgi:hypothetical protein